MAAFNITGVARVELFGRTDDRVALLSQAIHIFKGIRAGRIAAGADYVPDTAIIAHRHKTLATIRVDSTGLHAQYVPTWEDPS